MQNYPFNVSRSLDPSNRGLRSVVGLHDHSLSDADLNLIQDLADYKRHQLLRHTAPSGCLTADPFVFHFNTPNSFIIPAFDVLFRGERIQVTGHNSTSSAHNVVAVPPPSGGLQPGQLYVVLLELWAKALDPVTGSGYYVTPSGQRYYYPYGCVSAVAPLLTQFPDDTVDPSFNKVTTERSQLQWRLSVQPIPAGYDFTQHRYGLDPDPVAVSQVFGQGSASALTSLGYSPLARVTGEATLWAAGGDANNTLQTMDSYTYALPVAVLFQRTTSVFDPEQAPFGCASPLGGGLFASGLSGRFDTLFADIIGAGDVVDTRLATSLVGYDLEQLLDQGLTDIFTGSVRSALTRSDHPAGAIGSLLNEIVAIAPASVSAGWQNVQAVGSFDQLLVTVGGAVVGSSGIRNGLSTDARTYFTTVQLSTPVAGWGPITATLPVTVPAGTVISSVFAQYPNSSGRVAPLMGTQLVVAGAGSASVTVTPASYPTSGNPLLLTLGVTYPAATGIDLRKVSTGPVSGQLIDPDGGATGLTLPLLGVSDYSSSATIPLMTTTVSSVQVYTPSYSSSIFGVRVHVVVANTAAVPGTQPNTVTFTIPRTNLDGRFTGLYVTRALTASGAALQVLSRELSGASLVVTLQGPLAVGSTTELVLLCHQTAQAAINSSVRGAVAIEETMIIGSGTIAATPLTADLAVAQDRRVTLIPPASGSTVYTPGVGSTIIGYLRGGRLRGISGNDSGDQTGMVWVMLGTSDQFVPTPCSISISVASFTLTVPGTDLTNAPWFVVASFLPALSGASGNAAVAYFSSTYVPYQGEGVAGRTYRVVATGEEALVTTNGTGQAPIPGVQDVFPYDRQLPVATTLPTLSSWSDTDLANTPLGGDFDTNYDTKRGHNVEATFSTPLRTNDFVPPLQRAVQRNLRLGAPTGKGFSQITPHVGFAITSPIPESGMGLTYSTTAPLSLYVDNVAGAWYNDGLTPETPLPTISSALALLPPILMHPVSILLKGNTQAYNLSDLAETDFAYASSEGGVYCMGLIANAMQGAGMITIGCTVPPGVGVTPVVINGTGIAQAGGNVNDSAWAGSGAQFVAFLIQSGHVVFNNISFTASTARGSYPAFWAALGAVRVERAEVDFQNCSIIDPYTFGVTAWSGASVTWTNGLISLAPGEIGIMGSESSISASGAALTVTDAGGAQPTPLITPMSMVFFSVTAGGSLTLSVDDGPTEIASGAPNPTQETGFPLQPGPFPTVASAQLGSTIIATPTFFTQGQASLNGMAVLQVQTLNWAHSHSQTQATLIATQTQFATVASDSSSSVVGLFS